MLNFNIFGFQNNSHIYDPLYDLHKSDMLSWCQLLLLGSERILIFFEYDDFVDTFGGYHKIGLVLAVVSMYFMVFS